MARIFEFGTAPQAAAEGYKFVGEVDGIAQDLLAEHKDDDVVFVSGPEVFGQPGVFRFGRFERIAQPKGHTSKAVTLKAQATQIVALNDKLGLAPINSDDALHVAKVARRYARTKNARTALN